MVKPIPEAIPDEVMDEVRRQVAGGFTPIDEIQESVFSVFEEEYEADELGPWVDQAVKEALAAHLAAQADWPVPTDCDRLDRAFAALEQSGVIARQNFTCCGTCGVAEIGDEGQGDGYAFYHMQDTDSAVDGGGVYLNYGPMKPGVDPQEIAQRIVGALRKEGLTVEWDGSLEKRIWVSLEWRKRRKANG